MQKYNKYKNNMSENNKLLNHSVNYTAEDNVSDKSEYECLCNIFNKYVNEKKNEFFYKHEHKNKIKLFK